MEILTHRYLIGVHQNATHNNCKSGRTSCGKKLAVCHEQP